MNEFQEARWLQRWGPVDVTLHLVLVFAAVALLTLHLWKEWPHGGSHAA